MVATVAPMTGVDAYIASMPHAEEMARLREGRKKQEAIANKVTRGKVELT